MSDAFWFQDTICENAHCQDRTISLYSPNHSTWQMIKMRKENCTRFDGFPMAQYFLSQPRALKTWQDVSRVPKPPH